jgi:hypothetical protein
MARKDFMDQLVSLGYTVEERGENRIAFRYVVPVGKLRGQEIWLGLVANDDLPLNAPSGPHVSPRLFPIHPANDLPHPLGGVHESPFGPDWQYWSRPFQVWGNTDRSAAAYMSHIRDLFSKIKP